MVGFPRLEAREEVNLLVESVFCKQILTLNLL